MRPGGANSKIKGMEARQIDRRLAAAAIAAVVVVVVYALLAYLLAPLVWRHFERQPGLAGLEMTTRTTLGLPGDPINVGLEGSEEDVVCAMHAAGWRPADAVTLRSSLRIVGSVLLDRPYLDAPVSALRYAGRTQDLAFEKPSGVSARRRHHARFWKALDAGADGLPVWLGAAVYDNGVGLSHYTGQVTHHIAPDVDAERDLLISNLIGAKKVAETYSVSGAGPTLFARNGGGDPYFTDGEIAFAKLVPGCKRQEGGRSRAAPSAADCRRRTRCLLLVRRFMARAALALIERRPLQRRSIGSACRLIEKLHRIDERAVDAPEEGNPDKAPGEREFNARRAGNLVRRHLRLLNPRRRRHPPSRAPCDGGRQPPGSAHCR